MACRLRNKSDSDPDEERMAESMVKKMKASVEPRSTASATEGWKVAAIRKAVWHDAADGDGGTLCFAGWRGVKIPDQIIWHQWKSDPSHSMPDYLLKFISSNKGDESDQMKLYSHEERFFAGQNFVFEDIDRMGAIFLTTKEGQSDLAFSVKGKHVFGFEESDGFIIEDLALHDNTQYVKDFAHNHLAVLASVHDDGTDPQRRLAVELPFRPLRAAAARRCSPCQGPLPQRAEALGSHRMP
jgi:hypothetical protein